MTEEYTDAGSGWFTTYQDLADILRLNVQAWDEHDAGDISLDDSAKILTITYHGKYIAKQKPKTPLLTREQVLRLEEMRIHLNAIHIGDRLYEDLQSTIHTSQTPALRLIFMTEHAVIPDSYKTCFASPPPLNNADLK